MAGNQIEQRIGSSNNPLGGIVKKLNLSLQKLVTSNESANDFLNIDFNELINSGISIVVKNLFDIYEQLFYKIKKNNSPNQQSHYQLIHESLSYLNNFIDYCKPDQYHSQVSCDEEIKLLTNALRDINDQLFEEETSYENTNMIYINGSFLRGEGQDLEGLPVWIMVKGEKREIKSATLYETIKRLLGHAANASAEDIQTTLTFEELSSIDDGLPIESEIDIINIDETAGADVDFDIELNKS